ncbi:hypothetical protein PPL_00278 [Heterostelium album PN500]|uniref:Uncharacterized protein n=1 Tax=Heterostelium pallidum (strain ATCC 26659 / Pp 5 / PN500) TaxID=670386 RepID=D3AW11_HETP5|nr:hypothetical protein PPL_00278 [Heterostelium album PN500]EFA86484.1 hypothetical protein PPL_00278 [Heterostelium album PN500]|eukprot:XP_020438589.1 hypothetical protein PPL_00278 [Heterostelium album PN500]
MTELLLSAGVSALIHSKVHSKKVGNSIPLSASKLHKSMHSSGPVSSPDKSSSSNSVIYISDVSSGASTALDFIENGSLSALKSLYCSTMKRNIDEVAFVCNGAKLNCALSISDYKINRSSNVIAVPSAGNSAAPPIDFHLDDATLAPSYNYDFRGIKVDSDVYKRGGQIYERPVGYMRYAMTVLGQYSDGDQWLGVKGRPSSTESAPGEWIVSYHGTDTDEFGSMSNSGYKISESEQKTFSRGIYSTPSIKLAERFAQRFEFEGAQYLVILQNRVNPNTVEKLGNGTYYLSPNESDVRPYGICIKKI